MSYWAVWAIFRETRQVRCIIVTNRKRETLHGFLFVNIIPGTRLINDYWRGYNTIDRFSYLHDCINHSLHFVDPVDPIIHTNTTERFWRSLREGLPCNLTASLLKQKFKSFLVSYNYVVKNVSQKYNFLINLIKTPGFDMFFYFLIFFIPPLQKLYDYRSKKMVDIKLQLNKRKRAFNINI